MLQSLGTTLVVDLLQAGRRILKMLLIAQLEQLVGRLQMALGIERDGPLRHGAVAGVGGGDDDDVLLLLTLQHGAGLLSQDGAQVAAHVLVVDRLVLVEHVDDGTFKLVAHDEQVVDQLARGHLVVERVDIVDQSVDDDHLRAHHVDDLARVGHERVVAQAAQREEPQAVVERRIANARHELHLVEHQAHVGCLLLRVEEEHARRLQQRLDAPLLTAEQGCRTPLQHGALAALLLAFDGVDVLQGEEADAVDGERELLGLHHRVALDAQRLELLTALPPLLLLLGGLAERLGHDGLRRLNVHHRLLVHHWLCVHHWHFLRGFRRWNRLPCFHLAVHVLRVHDSNLTVKG